MVARYRRLTQSKHFCTEIYMGDDKVYIRPPDWWLEPIPEGHVFLLLKSIYGTLQAARRWHNHIPGRMEKNGYPAVNSEKTIFMKCQGDDFIIHCLFVDDMMYIPTYDARKQEFMEKYTKDFDITGGSLMETYLDMQLEQSPGKIRLHLNNYIRETLENVRRSRRNLFGRSLSRSNPDSC
jgi:hypothetical protein